MTDKDILENKWGFRPFEAECICLLFEKYFNNVEIDHVVLNKHYARQRPNWVTGFLVVIKAEMSKFEYVDRIPQVFLWGQDDKAYKKMYKAVHDEDYQTNCNMVLEYLDETKLLLVDDGAFEARFLSSLHFLQTNIPKVFFFVCESLDEPPSYMSRALSMIGWSN